MSNTQSNDRRPTFRLQYSLTGPNEEPQEEEESAASSGKAERSEELGYGSDRPLGSLATLTAAVVVGATASAFFFVPHGGRLFEFLAGT